MSEPSDMDRLEAARVPPDSGASFSATRHAGLALVMPLTDAAAAWLHAYADDEATWAGPALVIERRYFPLFAETAIAAGHTFEREPYLN